MRMQFIKENESFFAIAQQQIFKGYNWDEMQFAEITPALGGWMVRWEDDYSNPINFSTLIEAQKHVENSYFKHYPHSNGEKHKV